VRGGLSEQELSRPAIAICHSFPDCWSISNSKLSVGDEDSGDKPMKAPGCPCPAAEGDEVVYRVGRTMYETAGLPRHLVDHCNAMDEVRVCACACIL